MTSRRRGGTAHSVRVVGEKRRPEHRAKRFTARGTTAVDDRMPALRACSSPQRSVSPIGRLLHCGANEQPMSCRCCARAVVEQLAPAVAASGRVSWPSCRKGIRWERYAPGHGCWERQCARMSVCACVCTVSRVHLSPFATVLLSYSRFSVTGNLPCYNSPSLTRDSPLTTFARLLCLLVLDYLNFSNYNLF